ncbi:hypothetical protein ABZ990_28340 [Streptomyces sp. NPDC046203]
MRSVPDPADPSKTTTCTGTKSTICVYNDDGTVASQSSFPCGTCGSQ